MAAERDRLERVESDVEIGARVEHRGIRLGTVVDVIFDPGLQTVVGYEIESVDGIRRFLPRIACRLASRARVDVRVPTALLGSPQLTFYSEHGVRLSALGPSRNATFRGASNGYTDSGDSGHRRGLTSVFHVSSTMVDDGIARIGVVGEADLSTAPELRAALTAAIDGGARSVLVDLSRTTFIDSTTLGVLMGAVRRLRSRDGEIAIVCRDRNIRKIFEITLLDRIFSVFDSVDAGTAHLRESRSVPPAPSVGD